MNQTTMEMSLRNSPSIIEQARPNPCGIFDFGKAKVNGVDYFNCSIVARPDGDWLVARRSKWIKNFRWGKNDLMAFKLDGVRPLMGKVVNLHSRYAGEHFEDPRVICGDGCDTWIGVCNFMVNKKGWTGAHQILCHVDHNWQCEERIDPVYGFNQSDLHGFNGHEKNWLWFKHGGEMMLLYQAVPHTVNTLKTLRLDGWKTAWNHRVWERGEIRGGTPPVRIGNEYWTFFHSSTPWIAPRRQYHMGAYAFEAAPPFRPTRITKEPLLSGSQRDRWAEGKPLVVFPCGSLIREATWTVVGGCNDLDCFWYKIPHTQLEQRCSPL